FRGNALQAQQRRVSDPLQRALAEHGRSTRGHGLWSRRRHYSLRLHKPAGDSGPCIMLAGAADVKPDLLDLHLCARVIPSARDERQCVMVKTYQARNYEDPGQYLRDHGFDVLDAPATNNRVFLKKTNVSAAI